jgi:glycosyltransferase involved in cell wall biosynthesis
MKKILFVSNVNASWAQRDLEILKSQYEVKHLDLRSKFQYLNLSWPISILRSDIVFFWFGSLSFLPILILAKIFGKKIVTIAGGFDVAKAPFLDYGAFTHNWLSQKLRCFFFNSSNKILCVSKANMLETIINAKVQSSKCEVIYHGFEEIRKPEGLKAWNARKNQVVMISQGINNTFYRKGLDQFISLARLLPDYDFILMGQISSDFQDFIKRYGTSNIKLTGFVKFNSDEFCEILESSKYILQLSYYESFGCSVIDGAILGCYPIVYSQFALEELIQKHGKTFPYGSKEDIADFILKNKEFLNSTEIAKNYLSYFSIQKRVQSLFKAMDSI